ncbi:hypothetical protein JZ751_008891 [Albula glossodonta]|uniref:Proline and serine rich 2 n=1 Tax=Albula glossodonta TaxID=121402 RepID=A0A8T2PAM5_9TELE|nr:hypothetical protein JZ751_008891 [Albula glossodonta]
MPRSCCALDSISMDFHVSSDPRLHFGLNGSQESPRRSSQHRRPLEDEALQFLSREEKECILFFEETIESLDDDLEDPGLGLSSGSSTSVEGRSATPSPILAPERSPSPREQDIIDLVPRQPDLTGPKDLQFIPPMPDYRTMAVSPETHFEMKAKRDPMENFPSEFQFPPPPQPISSPSEGGFSHSMYQPAGSIPTPVVIAQILAEHQGDGSTFSPSSILSGRRRSLDSQSPPPENPVKQGPPTMAKPTRFPENISVMLGNKDYNQTIAKASVNVNERRARVLANLSGGPQSSEVEEPSVRKIPTRSISFRDPEPDKSRMEALSKLGLTQNRGLAGSRSRVITPTAQPTTRPESSSSNTSNYDSKPKVATPSLLSTNQTEVTTSDFNSYGGKSKVVNPSSMSSTKADSTSSFVINYDKSNAASHPSHADSTPSDFNSYGGKTKVMAPSQGSVVKSDPTSHQLSNSESRLSPVGPPQGFTAGKAEAPLSDFNSYGGKTKVMNPAPASTAKAETCTDGLGPYDSKAKATAPSSLSTPKAEVFPADLNSYGGKTKVVAPSLLSSQRPEVTVTDVTIPAVTPKTATAQPSAIPRQNSFRVEPRPTEACRSYRHEGAQSSHASSLPAGMPEARRRSGSKPSYFHQGITVQFSGRGATDESRREALRKLGLLKDTT